MRRSLSEFDDHERALMEMVLGELALMMPNPDGNSARDMVGFVIDAWETRQVHVGADPHHDFLFVLVDAITGEELTDWIEVVPSEVARH